MARNGTNGSKTPLQSFLKRLGRIALSNLKGGGSHNHHHQTPPVKFKYVGGVYKGQYVRRRIRVKQEAKKKLELAALAAAAAAKVPKLPAAGPTVMPKPLTPIPPPTSTTATTISSTSTPSTASSLSAASSASSSSSLSSLTSSVTNSTTSITAASAAGGGGGSASAAVVSNQSAKTGGGGGYTYQFTSRLYAWMKQNGAVLILNFGSICTLIGFTRQDVLELRELATIGSLSAVWYNFFQIPKRWPPVAWSALFAGVNAYNIYRIIEERKGEVHLSSKEEDIYVEHFLPHGVTPKQFEKLMIKAQPVTFKKGECMIRHGEKLQYVYLVTNGHTRANIAGRRLTAASSAPGNSATKVGGDAGAWVGEIAFLEAFWKKEQEKNQKTKKRKTVPISEMKEKVISEVKKKVAIATSPRIIADEEKEEEAVAAPVVNSTSSSSSSSSSSPPGVATVLAATSTKRDDNNDNDSQRRQRVVSSTKKPFPSPSPAPSTSQSSTALPTPILPAPMRAPGTAIYTIVAADDCEVLRWSHADIENLLRVSTDMRAAMTRAMTAAVVGKVINYTVSRTTARPTWQTWLDDWKHSAAARVDVHDVNDDDDDDDLEVDELIRKQSKALKRETVQVLLSTS